MNEDPSHRKTSASAIKAGFSEATYLEKLVAFITLFFLIFFIRLPGAILVKLGFYSNKNFKLKRVFSSSPEIYSGEYYTGVAISNVIVVKGKDGSLLLRSPPPMIPQVLEEILEIGKPKAILVTVSHDTHSTAWKEKFPDLIVLGSKQDEEVLDKRTKVDVFLESDEAKELLKNYYVTEIVHTKKWTRIGDEPILIMKLDEKRTCISVGCGISNFVDESYLDPLFFGRLIVGFSGGFRLLRPYALFFSKDLNAGQEIWNKLTEIEDLHGLLLVHGKSLVGKNVGEQMRKLKFVNARLEF